MRKTAVMCRVALVALAGALAASPAGAEHCYQLPQTRTLARLAPPTVQKEVLVLVDQTVPYPDLVRRHAIAEVARLAGGGSRITVGSFSYYSRTTFPRIHGRQIFEPDFPRQLEPGASMRALRNLKACLPQSRSRNLRATRVMISNALNASRPSIGQSDIMSSLRQFGERMRAARARDKVILLVSDMLENSSVTSFYDSAGLRTINPAFEMQKAARAGLLADLGGARVYVIGAGLIEERKHNTRTHERMRELERFWTAYFRRSNASLAGFGKPLLLAPMR